MKKHLLFGLLGLMCQFPFGGFAQESSTSRPNIVWITSEDNSQHYLRLFDKNGTPTPYIERLAQHGITFKRAFSNGAVCSVARSTLIAGAYSPGLGTQFHRRMQEVSMPEDLRMFPAYLREAGYFTANNAKEDYNQFKAEDVWDESSKKASWRHREEGQPFFYVHNLHITHESSLFFTDEEMKEGLAQTSNDSFEIHPYHPVTEAFQYTNQRYREKIRQMDQQVGDVIAKLEADGLLENTFIFYFGDHGGVLPGSKGYLKEVGLHVPLVLYIPPAFADHGPLAPGSTTDSFVSFIDFAPTVLQLAGIEIPERMDGTPFWGVNEQFKGLADRSITFSYADRFDEKYDMVRAVRRGQFKYIRNFQPYHQDGLWNQYRYRQTGYLEWYKLFKEGKLNDIQAAFFLPKQPEELYDLEADPFETRNLAALPEYRRELRQLRKALNKWLRNMPDLSFFPEHELIQQGALQNPTAFGQSHKKQIQAYLDICNLQYQPFEKIEKALIKSLQSEDQLARYWALVSCLSFGKEAKSLRPAIEQILKQDVQLVNQFYAATFLAILGDASMPGKMVDLLHKSPSPETALLMLNEMVCLRDAYEISFALDKSTLPDALQVHSLVKLRLDYICTNTAH